MPKYAKSQLKTSFTETKEARSRHAKIIPWSFHGEREKKKKNCSRKQTTGDTAPVHGISRGQRDFLHARCSISWGRHSGYKADTEGRRVVVATPPLQHGDDEGEAKLAAQADRKESVYGTHPLLPTEPNRTAFAAANDRTA